jgi:hypothetical protein
VELMGKEKGYNSSHVYCQAKGWSKKCQSHVYCQTKGWSKKSQENFLNDFEKGFLKWYDRGGENEITSKRIFEVEVSFSSQNVNFPFI